MTKREFNKATKQNNGRKMEDMDRFHYRVTRLLPAKISGGWGGKRNLAGWSFDFIAWRSGERPLEGKAMLSSASKWRNVAAYAATTGRPLLSKCPPANHIYR